MAFDDDFEREAAEEFDEEFEEELEDEEAEDEEEEDEEYDEDFPEDDAGLSAKDFDGHLLNLSRSFRGRTLITDVGTACRMRIFCGWSPVDFTAYCADSKGGSVDFEITDDYSRSYEIRLKIAAKDSIVAGIKELTVVRLGEDDVKGGDRYMVDATAEHFRFAETVLNAITT